MGRMELTSTENHKHLPYVQVNKNVTQDRALMDHTPLPQKKPQKPQKTTTKKHPSTHLKKGCVVQGEVWGELWGAQTRVILKACRNVNRQQLQRNSCNKKWYWGILCCLISASYWDFLNFGRVLPVLLHDLTPQFFVPFPLSTGNNHYPIPSRVELLSRYFSS